MSQAPPTINGVDAFELSLTEPELDLLGLRLRRWHASLSMLSEADEFVMLPQSLDLLDQTVRVLTKISNLVLHKVPLCLIRDELMCVLAACTSIQAESNSPLFSASDNAFGIGRHQVAVDINDKVAAALSRLDDIGESSGST